MAASEVQRPLMPTSKASAIWAYGDFVSMELQGFSVERRPQVECRALSLLLSRASLAQEIGKLVKKLQRLGPTHFRKKLKDRHQAASSPLVIEYFTIVSDVALDDADDHAISKTLTVIALLFPASKQDRVNRLEHLGRIAGDQKLIKLNEVMKC